MKKFIMFIALTMICTSLAACKEEDEKMECAGKGGVWVYQRSGKTNHQIGCIDPRAMIKLEN